MLVLTLRRDAADSFIAGLSEMFEETALWPGFQRIRAYRNVDNPDKINFVEEWESVADQQAYIACRTERGDVASIGAALAGPPQIETWAMPALAQALGEPGRQDER